MLLVGVIVVTNFLKSDDHQYKYVITETGGPTSFDPLDGDQTPNLSVQRMIYATPLEVDQRGTLKSLVLEDYNFDSDTNIMTWTAKSGQKFSDGSLITADDIAFAVARMAYKRPKFPVIENIQGVSEWSKETNALKSYPSGIRVSGNKIEIKFMKFVDHPLFRFCLEIFSIIPKRCVDLKTNTVNCNPLPVSGHYEISSRKENEIEFKVRQISPLKGTVPDQITFEYLSPRTVFSENYKPTGVTVIQGNEIKLSLEELKNLNTNLKPNYLPSARIALNLLNPNVGAFKNRNCRLIFAEAYRQASASLATNGFKIEASLFTELLPGYSNVMELKKTSFDQISQQEKLKCLSQLKTNPPNWAATNDESDAIYRIIAEKTFDVLGIPKPAPVKLENRKEEIDAFISGEVAIMGASTGLWALDPAGDIQMVFTPNMHKLLHFVSNDDKAQSLIKNLKRGNENSPDGFREMNQYIFDEAKFNVFAHVRRFYASDSLLHIAELPVSITSPAPYQVFRLK